MSRGDAQFGGVLICIFLLFILGLAAWDGTQHEKRVENVRKIRGGPATAKAEVSTGDTVIIPATLRVLSVSRDGKYSFKVTIEGPREDVANFMSQVYGIPR